MSPVYLSPGVYVEEIDRGSKPIEGVGTAVAAFVGFAEKGPVGEPTMVTSWSQYTNTFGGFFKGGYLAPAVYGYFANGGGTCFVNRLPGEIASASSNGSASGDGKALPAASTALPSRASAAASTLTVTSAEPGTTVEIRPPEAGAPDDQFTFVARRGESEEVFPNVSMGRGRNARNAVEVVNRESKLVQIAEAEAPGTLAERAPATGTYALAPSEPAPAALPAVNPNALVGNAAERTGINGLEVIDEITMVAVPDLMAAYQAGQLNDEGVRAVQTALMNHCEAMKDRVAILDAPPDLSPQQIREWRMNTAGYDSKYAALYYPWIQIANPVTDGDGAVSLLVPPSGHMAGIWARNDSERGVHKAPANEVIRGAIGLEKQLTRNEQDSLNPVGINCIRAFPGRGIRVWGARTLSSDPSWRYLNVRRLFNFVEKSIDNGTQWVVFEPNDFYLWDKVTRDVGAFLTRVWRDGALFGATPSEAYFVKCDAELNPPEVRDVGQLIVEVGIAPVKPAEFVIFRISQYSPAAA
ncbi:MAG: phage tail sheath subtilisin-like domain-containing protein [Chloroflexota bacterium]